MQIYMVYSTTTAPVIGVGTKVSSGTGTGAFTASLTGLSTATTYYARAFATNAVGTTYGSEISFTTGTTAPNVSSTISVTGITASTANSGGNILNDGGATILEMGLVYSTSTNPTTGNSKLTVTTSTGTYTATLTGLNPGVTYYVKAFATNIQGTVYGNEVSFTTSVTLPTMAASSMVTNITTGSATVNGDITATGGATITSKGLVFNDVTNPSLTSGTTIAVGSGLGLFTGNITGLLPGKTYYARAYATNASGLTAYGNSITFATQTTVPSITATLITTNVTATSVDVSGSILDDGGDAITERGFTYGQSANPTVSGTKTIVAGTTGAMSATISGLANATTYYIRPYATNSLGTAYGISVSIVTSGPPIVATNVATNVLTTDATMGATITGDGGSVVTAKGFVYSTDPLLLDIDRPVVTVGNSFTDTLSGLTASTTYYYKAYATNAIGTGYGVEKTFTTLPLATVNTSPTAMNITATTALIGGDLVTSGGITMTELGVVCDTGHITTTASSLKTTVNANTTGQYTATVSGLAGGQTYYARAYAINENGLSFGSEISFKTAIQPTVTTTAVNSITSITATATGDVTNDGGSALTRKGFVYGKTSNPTLLDIVKDVAPGTTGSYNASLTGLTKGATYYLRAFATNIAGTNYGSEIQFTTPNLPIVVTSTTAISLTSNSAVLVGTITSNGGNAVTESGIAFGTSLNPTISGTHEVSGVATGQFSVSATTLNAGTTYYYRAYANNISGTAYGQNYTFTTLDIPRVSTTSLTAISTTTLNIFGNVTADGGSTITERGVVYSTAATPTLSDQKVTQSGQTGAFNVNISGLAQGETYYVRAYATNAQGTTYGVIFTKTMFVTPQISTSYPALGITSTSADVEATITTGIGITERGIVYSTSSSPTVAGSKIVDASAVIGTYQGSIAGLTGGTTYYAKGYVIYPFGTIYGNEISFNTPTHPTVTTSISAVTLTTNSAIVAGDILSNGGSTVTEAGIVWGTALNPIGNAITTSAVQGTYTTAISGLSSGTAYYYRAFAKNIAGIAYGQNQLFTTYSLPSVSTISVTATSPTAISAVTNVSSDGGSSLTGKGVVYALTSSPTISNSSVTTAAITGQSTVNITGLTEGTTYYIRSYATNIYGTSYGNEMTVTMQVEPQISTSANAINVTIYTAGVAGNVSTGTGISDMGIVYGTSSGPTIAGNKVQETVALGNFQATLMGLSGSTTYYARTYATYIFGTVYGNEMSFTTAAVTPVVLTVSATSISVNTAVVGGEVTTGTGITQRGIAYSTTANPTLSDSKVIVAGTLGTYQGNLTGLVAATNYYARAYATNEDGTVYGDQVSLMTTANSTSHSSGGGGTVEIPITPPITVETNPTSTNDYVVTNNSLQNIISKVTETADKKEVNVELDATKIINNLNTKSNEILIDMKKGNNINIKGLTALDLSQLNEKNTSIAMNVKNIQYTLEPSQLNVEEVAKALGSEGNLKAVNIEIRVKTDIVEETESLKKYASKENFKLVADPVKYEVECSKGDKSLKIDMFNGYTRLVIEVRDVKASEKVTTGIRMEEDGTITPVPTKIIKKDGKTYAVMSSLKPGTFVLINKEVKFNDVQKRWSKEIIYDMAARLILEDTRSKNFKPDQQINRGEFAKMALRSLGLTGEGKNDIEGYLKAAQTHGIMKGYTDGTMKADKTITREEAFVMISRLEKLANMISKTKAESSKAVKTFKDSSKIAGWAQEGAQLCIDKGVIEGFNNQLLPKNNITNAEAAKVMFKVLKADGLI